MSLTGVTFWIVYIAGVCGALLNPILGVALYVLVYHVNPETQWWGGAVRELGLRCSLIVAVATGAGMLLRPAALLHGARQFPAPYVLAILFGLVALASLGWGVGVSERGAYQAEKFVKLMIILFILLRCVRTPAHYQLVVLAWLAGVTYLGYQASGGVGRSASGRLTSGIGGPDFEDSSGLAAHLIATLPLIGAMFFMCRTWLGRGLTLVTGALAVNTLVMTRTRNAVVGLVVVVFATLLGLPRGYRLKGFAAALVGTLLAVQLTDPAWWQRMRTIAQYETDASATGRLAFWRAAVQMACDHPLGIGLGNFHQTVMEYIPDLTIERSAHSTVIACLAELGWGGLFLFVLIVVAVLLRLAGVRRAARGVPDFQDVRVLTRPARFHLGWHALALRAGLLGYLACALFTTRLFAEDFWLLIGLS
ncbi:MAG: O-antigen ligase family protein, partial [Planctomycetota bacterium]